MRGKEGRGWEKGGGAMGGKDRKRGGGVRVGKIIPTWKNGG